MRRSIHMADQMRSLSGVEGLKALSKLAVRGLKNASKREG